MAEVPGSEQEFQADLVFLAMGFLGPETAIKEALEVETDPRSNFKTPQGKYSTSVPKVCVCVRAVFCGFLSVPEYVCVRVWQRAVMSWVGRVSEQSASAQMASMTQCSKKLLHPSRRLVYLFFCPCPQACVLNDNFLLFCSFTPSGVRGGRLPSWAVAHCVGHQRRPPGCAPNRQGPDGFHHSPHPRWPHPPRDRHGRLLPHPEGRGVSGRVAPCFVVM